MKRLGLYIAILLLTSFVHAQPISLFTTTHFSTRQGLPSSDITAITQDARGAIWVGTTDGLARFNGSQFQIFDRSTTNLPSNHITTLYTTIDNALWIGTERGITQERDETFTTFQSANQPILSIDSNNEGTIFIQSTTGTFELSGAEFIATKKTVAPVRRNWLKESKELNIPDITTIFIDRELNRWIGTRHGLFLLISGPFSLLNDKKNMVTDTQKEPLSSAIHALFEDKNRRLWILSKESGITIVKENASRTLNSLNGLPADTIFSMTETADETLWFCSTRGIFSISSTMINSFFDKKTDKIVARKYGIGDGLPSIKCSTSAKDSATLLGNKPLFSTEQGALLIDPSKIEPPIPPDTIIEKVSSNGIPLPLFSPNIAIFAGESISVTLSAISIRYPDHIRFEWKLDIPGNSWNSMESQKTLSLDRLDPGEYEVRFRALFHDFPLAKPGKEAHLSFTVTPQTVWSRYLLFGGAILLFIISIFLWMKYKIVSAKLSSETQESDTPFHADLYPTHLPSTLKKMLAEEKLYTDSDLTLRQLAKKCGTNTATLSRFINSELDSTFYNLINGYRLEMVKQLLIDSEHHRSSVLSLAYLAGFKSKTTFNTMFKRETNLTPTEWRKQKTE